MTQPSPSRIRFGLFELDSRSGELHRNGYKIDLQEQPFQALLLLLEHSGEVVTRDDLHKHLWPQDTFVDFDRGLNKAINKLRAALRDNPDNPRYIETLPQRGYRFIATVERPPQLPDVVQEPNETSQSALAQGPTPSGFATPGQAQVAVQQPDATGLERSTSALIPDSARPRENRKKYLYYGWAILSLVIVAIGARIVFRTMQARRAPPALASESRLTASSPDLPVTTSAISPDGKYLAYTDSTGFYLRLVANGETHAVSLPNGFDASVESWFPDSVHLVVSSIDNAERPPSLWEISALGGTPRKLADIGSFARVSPNGKQIAFLKGPWDNNQIWLVDANGNGAHKVIDGGSDSFGPTAWAPDGNQFAYLRFSPERSTAQIETYDPQDGHTQTILSASGLTPLIVWISPDRMIYIQQEPQPNQNDFNLWRIQLDARTLRQSGMPTRLSNGRDAIASISVTSDGRRIALQRANSQADIYLTDLSSRGNQLSPPRRFTNDERQDFPSSWTPDSTTVLLVSDRDGPNHIFKQKIDQAQPELLVGGKDDVWLPHMTPDGSSVLYMANSPQSGPSGNVRLMRISLSGGPSFLVLEKPGIVNYQCARLPSQLCVYGQSDSEFYRFFRFDPQDGKSVEISAARLKKEAGLNSWNLSPDGKYLVTCRSQNPYEKPGLRVFRLADNTEGLLPVTGIKLIIGTDWAVDSKSILVGGYMGRSSRGTRSGLINVDLGGQVRTLIQGETPVILGGTPSPDGRHLALGANTFSSNVWLLENF